jgi:hypothetical protein
MTLAELRDAYARGELTEPVSIDNDSVNAYKGDTDGDWQDIEEVYSSYPEETLERALDLLGIPWEHVL